MKKYIPLFSLASALLISGATFADTDTSETNTTNDTAQIDTSLPVPAPQPSLRQQMFQLQQRVNKLYKEKKDEGVHTQFGDHVSLSGGINVQTAFSNRLSPTSFTSPGNQTLDLNTAYLNFNALLASWLRTFFSLTYEPNGVTTTTGGAFTAPEVEQAYIQFGNTKTSHYHFDLGKQYLPFGVYNRYPVVDSLTQSLAEVNKVGAVAGVDYDPFFASVYAFSAQGSLKGFGVSPRDQLMNGGAEVGIINISKKFGYEASLGYMNNMAETRFIYGVIKSTNKAVGELAGHLSFNIYRLGVITNMIYPIDRFLSTDITYNGQGARPSAYEAEVNYAFTIHGHPLVPALGYEASSQALFLSLARYRYVGSLEYTINKYLTATLELLKSKNYAVGDTGTYATGTSTIATVTGNGRWNDAAVIQLAANF